MLAATVRRPLRPRRSQASGSRGPRWRRSPRRSDCPRAPQPRRRHTHVARRRVAGSRGSQHDLVIGVAPASRSLCVTSSATSGCVPSGGVTTARPSDARDRAGDVHPGVVAGGEQQRHDDGGAHPSRTIGGDDLVDLRILDVDESLHDAHIGQKRAHAVDDVADGRTPALGARAVRAGDEHRPLMRSLLSTTLSR